MELFYRLLALMTAFVTVSLAIFGLSFFFDNELGIGARIFFVLFFAILSYGSYRLTSWLWLSKLPQLIQLNLKVTATPNPTPTKAKPKPLPKWPNSLASVLKKPELEELVSLAEVTLIDDRVDQFEAEELLEWFRKHPKAQIDNRTKLIYQIVERSLADQELDANEAEELKTRLSEFCDSMQVEWDKEAQKGRTAKDKKSASARMRKSSNASPAGCNLTVASGDELLIDYVDAKGDESERSVLVRSVVEKNSHLYLNAICLEKHKFRSFRADRIQYMVMLRTGEHIADPYGCLVQGLK